MMEELRTVKCISCGQDITSLEKRIHFKYCPVCGNQLNKDIVPMPSLEEGIEKMVYDWLGKTLNIEAWLVSETVQNQVATVFLLIWPILETKIFNGNMSTYKMERVADKAKKVIGVRDIEPMAKHFYDRYQDCAKYAMLYGEEDRRWDKVDVILNKKYDKITKKEKIEFLIYIVYRYRNNIFHGRKTIRTWSNFKTEIDYCIRFMLILGNQINNE